MALYHATGTGKTINAVTDSEKLGRRALFIAHTKELTQQAKEAFEKAWSEVSCNEEAVNELYSSYLYELLEKEETKFWQYSTEKLFEMFLEEKNSGKIDFPQV